MKVLITVLAVFSIILLAGCEKEMPRVLTAQQVWKANLLRTADSLDLVGYNHRIWMVAAPVRDGRYLDLRDGGAIDLLNPDQLNHFDSTLVSRKETNPGIWAMTWIVGHKGY